MITKLLFNLTSFIFDIIIWLLPSDIVLPDWISYVLYFFKNITYFFPVVCLDAIFVCFSTWFVINMQKKIYNLIMSYMLSIPFKVIGK